MKRIICLLTALCLVLGSFSFCFASPTSWDTSDQTNLRGIYTAVTSGNLYNLVSTISTRLNTISNTLTDIKGLLSYGGHSVADLVDSILTWMNPILTAIQQTPLDLEKIYMSLNYTTDTDNDGNLEYHPYLLRLQDLSKALTHYYSSGSSEARLNNAHVSLMGTNGIYTYSYVDTNNTKLTVNRQWFDGTPIGNLGVMLRSLNDSFANSHFLTWNAAYTGYNSAQTGQSWTDINSSVSFTPTSQTNGLYNWLKNIQIPIARLSYVLASDERIAAQEAAAANEEAVVDNFIESSGAGSASPSDIGSISDLSSGYKNNFSTDASASDFFDIFDSDNFGWFSQETADSLDTTANTRKRSSFDTPLLDQQINDIYNALGVKHD